MKKIISCIALFALLNACKKESLKSDPSEFQRTQNDDQSKNDSYEFLAKNGLTMTKFPTIATNIFPTQTNANSWNDPIGALGIGGGAATASLSRNGICNSNVQCYKSSELQVTGFGFNIPADATIINIKVQVKSKASVSNSIKDLNIQLANWDNVSGIPVNRASDTYWNTKFTVRTYVGSPTVWGMLAHHDFGLTSFGLRISCSNLNTSSSAIASIDFVKITIEYTVGASQQSQSSQVMVSK